MLHNTDVLAFSGIIPQQAWQITINIREPLYIKSKKNYIGGLDVCLKMSSINSKKQIEKNSEEENKTAILELKIGIAGLFAVEEEKFSKEVEDNLVKVQIPAILFPYVRATITSLLANAGFGATILPLFNIHEIAKQSPSIKIKEID